MATPFPVSSGTTYRFVVDNTSGDTQLRFTGNEYADGNLVTGGNGYANPNDLDFEINMTISAVAPTGIPTLSEWGLIVLALLFMTMGTLYLVQPNFRGRLGFEQELVDGKEL
ncbi:MAG: IPTL-CTERM sorting domain-containing protein [Chitinophagales bacterium]